MLLDQVLPLFYFIHLVVKNIIWTVLFKCEQNKVFHIYF